MTDLMPIKCTACGSTDYKVIVNDMSNGRRMVRCSNCYLIYVIPLWTTEVANQVFSHRTDWPAGLTGGQPNRTASMQFIAQQIAAKLPQGGSLLDIGCADGQFFNAMRQTSADWQLYGAEPDPKWEGLDYKGAHVTHHSLRECQFANGQFDVVTILDAFYYIPDPELELAEINRILKPNGLLVFDHSGMTYLRLRGLIGSMFGMQRTTTFSAYPFYFSDKSLTILLSRCGFQIIDRTADQGVEHTGAMGVFMPLYSGAVKLSTSFVQGFITLSPKIVYIARRVPSVS